MTTKAKDIIIVLIVFALGALAIATHLNNMAQRIEQKLQDTIINTLHSNDLTWVEVSTDGRDVTLEGTTATRQKYNQVQQLVQSISGIHELHNNIEVQLPRVTPYSLTAKYQNKHLQLTGYMPNLAALDALQNYATNIFAEQKIDNFLELAAGEPANWQQVIHLTLKNLPHLEQAQIEATDYNIRLTGIAETEEIMLQVKHNLNAIKDYQYQPYVYLQIAKEKPPVKIPYIFNAEYNNKKLSLEGYLPDLITQQLMDENLAYFFNNVPIDRNLKLASGEPVDWQKLLLLLLENLSYFQTARLEVINYNVRVSGILQTTARLELVKDKLNGFANKHYRFQLYLKASDEKEPPARVTPYTFSAEYQAQELRSQGYFPSQEARRDFINYARNTFAGEKFIDAGLQIASGEPAHWQLVITKLTDALKQFQQGRLELTNYEVRLTGTVATTETQEALDKLTAQLLPYNYHLELYVEAADAQSRSCQRRFNHLLATDMISFASNSTIIESQSMPLLENLLMTTKSCPAARITIAGHTDNLGDPARNLQLSQQRAETVQAYLINNGFPKNQLKAIGYGETRPLARNDTPEGQAKNRRIEFLIEGY